MPLPFQAIRFQKEGWRYSKRGNLYQRLPDGETCTIFPDSHGRGWRYCVYSDGDGAVFSQETYPTEEDAVRALTWYLVETGYTLE